MWFVYRPIKIALKIANSWNWTLSMSKPKILLIGLLLKFPNMSEICVLHRPFKGKMAKKYQRVTAEFSTDARTLKL